MKNESDQKESEVTRSTHNTDIQHVQKKKGEWGMEERGLIFDRCYIRFGG
jgi:hypothetical protein